MKNTNPNQQVLRTNRVEQVAPALHILIQWQSLFLPATFAPPAKQARIPVEIKFHRISVIPAHFANVVQPLLQVPTLLITADALLLRMVLHAQRVHPRARNPPVARPTLQANLQDLRNRAT